MGKSNCILYPRSSFFTALQMRPVNPSFHPKQYQLFMKSGQCSWIAMSKCKSRVQSSFSWLIMTSHWNANRLRLYKALPQLDSSDTQFKLRVTGVTCENQYILLSGTQSRITAKSHQLFFCKLTDYLSPSVFMKFKLYCLHPLL